MKRLLPNTIEGLQDALARGEVSLEHAWRAQVDEFALAGKLTRCVTDYFDVPKPTGALGSLDGVGLAHKDIFSLQGREPGLGRDHGHPDQAAVDASAVARLKHLGALNLGALTMAEDACAATGETANLAIPLNPLGADIAVGGSSSGSGVAVAAGMVYGSLGTDTAGSVRIPAMTCGVMGLKTTHGLVDRRGMFKLAPSLDSIGFLARSVGDLSLLLAAFEPMPSSTNRPSQTLNVGYWLEGTQMSSDVSCIVEPIMLEYGTTGLHLNLQEKRASAWLEVVMAYEIGQTHRARIAQGTACQQVVDVGTYGLSISPVWHQHALRERPKCLKAFVDVAFASCDVVLMPLQVDSLPRVDEVYLTGESFSAAKLLGLHRYCGWINYLGLPSLAIPVGYDDEGLPVSIQIVGRPFHEADVLVIGRQIQHDIHGENGIEPVLRLGGSET